MEIQYVIGYAMNANNVIFLTDIKSFSFCIMPLCDMQLSSAAKSKHFYYWCEERPELLEIAFRCVKSLPHYFLYDYFMLVSITDYKDVGWNFLAKLLTSI